MNGQHRYRVLFLMLWLCCSHLRADVIPALHPASKVNTSGITAAQGASAPIVSADGQRVAFISRSSNLDTNRTSGELNVYLRTVATSNTVLVSRTRAGACGNAHSILPSLSSNGTFVAFQSEASNLVMNDANHASDIFVYDDSSGALRLVSVNANGTPASGESTYPIISEDGRYVTFESTAPDLVANDFNGLRDI